MFLRSGAGDEYIINIRQKIFNQKYCNVGMTQQRSLAKKDKKSDVTG